MNAVRCPQCSLVNPTSAVECNGCKFPLTHLPSSAYVSVPATDYAKTSFAAPPPTFNTNISIHPDNETGRKTHFWYKVYCSFLALMYLGVGFVGLAIVSYSAQLKSPKGMEDPVILGTIYAVLGFALFIPFAIAPFLPRKPWNWIVGILFMAVGLSSCCLWPALIPMLIYWFKPETQAYFGKKV